jgi:protoporphyrinogen oxidase
VSALNALPESGSAAHFAAVLREGFFSRARDCDLGYATVGLSTLYTGAAQDYVKSHDGRVCLGAAAEGVEVEVDGGHVIRVKNDSPVEADAVICAVPPPALIGLLSDRLPEIRTVLSAFRPSPILSVNLWFDRPVIEPDFVGLRERRTNWVFNKAAMYRGRDRASACSAALVTSAAHGVVDLADEQLVAESLADLRVLFPAAVNAHLVHHLVIRERQATFALPQGLRQPGPRTGMPGLYLAGDWTDTGLPCTIESAVRSGYEAAECALEDGL